jgi:hypothetical protein
MIVEAMEQEISQFAVCNIIINNTNEVNVQRCHSQWIWVVFFLKGWFIHHQTPTHYHKVWTNCTRRGKYFANSWCLGAGRVSRKFKISVEFPINIKLKVYKQNSFKHPFINIQRNHSLNV